MKIEIPNEESIDPFDRSAVRACLLDIERDFNKKREQLFYKIRSYFHQSISSNYISSEELHKMIDECEELKKEYINYKNFVAKTRGSNYVI